MRPAFGGVTPPPTRTTRAEIEAAVVPASPNVLALIGRDRLARCQFVYDGLNCDLLLVY